jgi:hypothetical protein
MADSPPDPALISPPTSVAALQAVLYAGTTDLRGQASEGLRANPCEVVRMQNREGAFRDVSNALVAYQKIRQRREGLEQQTTAAAPVRLARLRDNGGHTSYLDVLTNDANLYAAQLALAPAQHQEAPSLVQPYGALGGMSADRLHGFEQFKALGRF